MGLPSFKAIGGASDRRMQSRFKIELEVQEVHCLSLMSISQAVAAQDRPAHMHGLSDVEQADAAKAVWPWMLRHSCLAMAQTMHGGHETLAAGKERSPAQHGKSWVLTHQNIPVTQCANTRSPTQLA